MSLPLVALAWRARSSSSSGGGSLSATAKGRDAAGNKRPKVNKNAKQVVSEEQQSETVRDPLAGIIEAVESFSL